MVNIATKIEYHIRPLRCKSCPEPRVIFDHIIIVEATVCDEYTKVKISDVPKRLNLYGTEFKLSIITAYTTNHFISFYINKANTIIELDDQFKNPTARRKNFLIVPQFFIYIKVSD